MVIFFKNIYSVVCAALVTHFLKKNPLMSKIGETNVHMCTGGTVRVFYI